MKKIIKSIVFLIVFFILWHYIFSVLWVDKRYVSYSYDNPKKSLDVVFIGASNVFVHFNNPLAYDLYGFASEFFSTGEQPFPATKYLIKESQKYQNPKLYVIDIARLAYSPDTFTDATIRRTTDSMKFSKNRIDAINDILSYTDIDKKEYLNYYFSFFLYHNGYKEINEMDFRGNTSLYKGYYFSEATTKIVPFKTYKWPKNEVELPEENKKMLMDLINYIKSNNINALFIIPTKNYADEDAEKLNTAVKIIKENEFNVINFNTLEDLKIDFSHDLYNISHLNIYGSTKYTLYFAKYLKENYDLPNHKGDEKYSSYESEYKRFKKDFKKLMNKDFKKFLNEYK